MSKYDKLLQVINSRPAAEAAFLRKRLLAVRGHRRMSQVEALALATDIILAGERSRRKKVSDAQTDVRRRITVGAHLSRETAEAYRAQASGRGESLYKWARDAFHEHYERLKI